VTSSAGSSSSASLLLAALAARHRAVAEQVDEQGTAGEPAPFQRFISRLEGQFRLAYPRHAGHRQRVPGARARCFWRRQDVQHLAQFRVTPDEGTRFPGQPRQRWDHPASARVGGGRTSSERRQAMDPVTISAVLMAIVGGASGELGSRLWDGLSALVRRPFRHRQAAAGGEAPVPSGETELARLESAPADRRQDMAMALAQALVTRADADEDFGQMLAGWLAQASQVHVSQGNVTNTITGGTFHGSVTQARDVTNVTHGGPAAPQER
jgi:hypothetical protein